MNGLDISWEPVHLTCIAMKRQGLIGTGTERDRRPKRDKLNRLFRCCDDNEQLTFADDADGAVRRRNRGQIGL